MNENNSIIENLEQKVNVVINHYGKRVMFYFFTMFGLPTMLMLFIFVNPENKKVIAYLEFLTYTLMFVILLAVSCIVKHSSDPFSWFFNSRRHLINETKKDIKKTISQKDVQVEVLEFFEPMPHAVDIEQLKKSFAFNDYDTALFLIINGFNRKNETGKEVDKIKNADKLLKDYEASLVNSKIKL